MYLPFPKQRKRAGKVTIVIRTKKKNRLRCQHDPTGGDVGTGAAAGAYPYGVGGSGPATCSQNPAGTQGSPSALFPQHQVKAGLFSSCCHPGERNRIFGSAETIHSAKSSEFSSRTFLSSKDCQSSRNQIVVSLRTAICSASFQLPCSKSKNG